MKVNSMAKLGTEKRPIIVRVKSNEMAEYVVNQCRANDWRYIIGFAVGNEAEDISDLEGMLNPVMPAISVRIGRNEPCKCGSGKKYKKCCGPELKH